MNVLQICHDAKGPFVDICKQYAGAFPSDSVTTVYLCGPADDGVAHGTGGDRVLFFEFDTAAMRGVKWRVLTRLAAVMRETDFDVVIAHRYKCIYLAGVLSYAYRPRALLGVVHEHNVLKRPTRSMFVRWWCRHLVLLAVSDSVARNIQQYCGELSGRLFTVYHAVREDLQVRLLNRTDARSALDLTMAGEAFVCVGRLVRKKNHALLIDALHRSKLDIHLSIIGDGPLRSSLEQQVDRLGMTKRVVFHGHVKEAFRYLKAFDGLVLASGGEEAFGMALLEACVAELPIVCSDAGGPGELGIADLVFEAGNADVLADRLVELTQLQSRSSQERLQHFTMDTFSRRMTTVLSAVSKKETRE
ncbi:MAG: hypothetical protein CMQ05_16790 [Gammaproteobacteria bacterium]|uniref:Glycosyltransferase subfamily 4-like N-terminal domain-containing protein n=1 Tax=OM182 bacterium MED-G24 TaxID=1986255 RepID=A0A2A5X0G0_9GAMM|nr:hypothetical protein [Gammaproteobacteria bacterium]PDH42222.1 MAG: hypothetical protein CNE99_00485 [OM182 bacterium MED-G24]RPG23165.1 MAG: glycosyltransferase [Gammaproteobacteria bacterium TMED50]|tara:strand:+ start:2036 stop:3115 length:1080 start_codon:yes stop_codon:yes gene_type:complete